jgi:hypothetical protein
MCFVQFSIKTTIISLNRANQLISVVVKICVSFVVRTEFYYFNELRLQGIKRKVRELGLENRSMAVYCLQDKISSNLGDR